MGVLSLMGPRSRELLQSLTPDDVSDQAFPFATSRVIELGFALVRASRITYVGELGWEFYVPTEFMLGVYEELIGAGGRFGLVHAGYHALNSLRIEKAYRHWGHDITDEDTPWKPALDLRSSSTSAADSSGARRCCGSAVPACASVWCNSSSIPPNPSLYHNEPIWQGDALVGFVRSGMYAHTLGAAVGLGYVAGPLPARQARRRPHRCRRLRNRSRRCAPRRRRHRCARCTTRRTSESNR